MKGKITDLGGGRFHIDFHPGRHKERVRRVVRGERAAQRILNTLQERAYAEQFGWPVQGTTTVKEICELVVQDYVDNNRKTQDDAREFLTFWDGQCGGKLADDVTGDLLKDWARAWRKGGLSSARCNRRIAFLLRGFRLASEKTPPIVKVIPSWSKLAEAPPRQGFREWEEFVAIREALPLHGRIPVSIEYWTGMRSGEVHELLWVQVRFDHTNKVVHIRLPDSKSGRPRLIAMGGDLYEHMREWHVYTRKYPCEYVCHRKGKRVKSIKTAWMSACVKVGLGSWAHPHEKYVGQRGYRGPLLHDFRRTAVRNLDRAGVPRQVAMSISGHETESIFARYRIVNEADLVEAGARVVADHEKRAGGQTVDTGTLSKSKSPRHERRSVRRSAVS